MHPIFRFGLLAGCVALAACADLQTVSRRTTVPGGPTVTSSTVTTTPSATTTTSTYTSAQGLAIHLDAQQRLVSFNALGKYCAEPSPDALAAYASSLGFGASAQGYGSASATQALQSAAASIGLRTQSITLMRDSLYRLCEAYLNGELSDVSGTMLLARSQDLTAVVVAVEQLTGAVAANQALLAPNASSSASANLVSNQQLLDAARKDEAEKEKTLANAKKAQEEQKKKVEASSGRLVDAKKEYEKAREADPKASNTAVTTAETNLKDDQKKLEEAGAEVKRREDLLAESKKIREIIESNRDAALTQATATTGSSGQFSTPTQIKTLDKEASIQIAKSVEAMVRHALDKQYTEDACLMLLTSYKQAGNTNLDATRMLCRDLINAKVGAQEQKIQIARFSADESADRITKAVTKDPSLRQRLEKWLSDNEIGASVTLFIYGSPFADKRRQAIQDLKIP